MGYCPKVLIDTRREQVSEKSGMLTKITRFLALVTIGTFLSTGLAGIAHRESFDSESCTIGCVCVSLQDCPCCGYEGSQPKRATTLSSSVCTYVDHVL